MEKLITLHCESGLDSDAVAESETQHLTLHFTTAGPIKLLPVVFIPVLQDFNLHGNTVNIVV